MHDDIDRVLFTEEQLAQRVAELGRQITLDYDEPILLVSVLRGAAIFVADLARKIDLPVELDFMALSSYGNSTKSSGVVQILKDTTSSVEGRHVLIAEDVLDSGLTLAYLIETLQARRPASLAVATLLHKRACQKADISCRYVGFDCPDEFVVGYGLDYAEKYRNLPYIGVLKPEVYTS